MNISLEQEIKNMFNKYNIIYEDNTNSYDKLDFVYHSPDVFSFDVKEKRQTYNMNNWTDKIKEKDCFVIDELAIRKVLYYGPNSGIIVRNNILNNYTFYSFVDLFLIPKIRGNRKINYNVESVKGKWIINLNDGYVSNKLENIFLAIKNYKKNKDKILLQQTSCYGNYNNEDLSFIGTERGKEYREKDYAVTR